jgi:hypothetical protein
MNPKFTWRAEMEFSGTPEEFNALTAALDKLSITVMPDKKWPRPPWPGLLPMPVAELLGSERVTGLASSSEFKAYLKFLKGLAGGIREPHLHLAGEVVFLDREAFKEYVVETAQALAERRVDFFDDYVYVMAGLEPIAVLPLPLP